jgi:hypothetical protein
MNKNAYEIRLEVLNLAHGDSWNTAHEKLNVLREQDNIAMDLFYKKRGEKRGVGAPTPLPKPSFNAEAIESLIPSTASIKARAEELYSFVEGR